MSDSAGGSKKSVDMPLCQTRKPSGAWPVRHVVFGCVDGDQFSLAVIREEKEGQRERSASRVKSRDQGGEALRHHHAAGSATSVKLAQPISYQMALPPLHLYRSVDCNSWQILFLGE